MSCSHRFIWHFDYQECSLCGYRVGLRNLGLGQPRGGAMREEYGSDSQAWKMREYEREPGSLIRPEEELFYE